MATKSASLSLSCDSDATLTPCHAGFWRSSENVLLTFSRLIGRLVLLVDGLGMGTGGLTLPGNSAA